jgi:hypothetical protein
MTTIWQKTKNRYDPKEPRISPAEAEAQREQSGRYYEDKYYRLLAAGEIEAVELTGDEAKDALKFFDAVLTYEFQKGK